MEHRRVDGVQLLWTVELDVGDTAGDLDGDPVGHLAMLSPTMPEPQDWEGLKRPLLATLVLGALAALVPTAALAAPVPIAKIAPEVDGLPVDSAEYRTLASRAEATAATL